MDVIALHQAGVVTAVAPMGTAFKPEQLKIVWGVCKEPLMLFDNDLAGYNALHKVVYGALEQIGQHQMLQIGSLKRAKDPDDMLRQFGIPALLSVVEAPSAVSEYILDYELQLKPYKTPEQKFDLEKRLALVASAIKDRDLQRQYQIFFKDSLWQLNRRTKKGHVAESSRDVTNEYISGVMHQPDPLIHKLSKVMMLYPQLLLDNQLFEGYIDLNFTSGDLEAFRIELLKSFDIISSDGGEKDKMARDFMMLSDAMMKKFPKIASIPTEVVDYDEAFSYAIRLIKLISLGRLSAEIEMISRKMSQVADDVDFQKFKHLLEIQETLKLELGVI
jgi:DNA primase